MIRYKTRVTNAAQRRKGTADPSRTYALRKGMLTEIARRFSALKARVRKLVVQEDMFGLVANAAKPRAVTLVSDPRTLSWEERQPNYNQFCATGPGGGVDPSCGKQVETGLLRKAIGGSRAAMQRVIDKTPGAKWLQDKTEALKDGLAERYGAKTAAAIVLSGQAVGWGIFFGATPLLGFPLYVPASTVVGMVPGIVIAELAHRMKAKQTQNVDVEKLARDFVTEVKRLWESHTGNSFCATGVGGGVDATCSPPSHREVEVKGVLVELHKDPSEEGLQHWLGGRFAPPFLRAQVHDGHLYAWEPHVDGKDIYHEDIAWKLGRSDLNRFEDHIEVRLDAGVPVLSTYTGAGNSPETVKWAEKRGIAYNAFCATGEGGGIDPTCGKVEVTKHKVADYYKGTFTHASVEWAVKIIKDIHGAQEARSWGIIFGPLDRELSERKGEDSDTIRTLKQTGFTGAAAVGVFRRVGAAVEDFIRKERPERMHLTAALDEPSRVHLYDKASKFLASRNGYTVSTKDTGIEREYHFVKTAGAQTSNEDYDLAYNRYVESPILNLQPYFAVCPRDEKGRCMVAGGVAVHVDKDGLAMCAKFGMTPEHVAAVAGALPGATVTIKAGRNYADVVVDHPYYSSERSVFKEHVVNDVFITEHGAPKGIGLAAFTSQVDACASHGMTRIDTTAAGFGRLHPDHDPDDGFNGYYTWPRYGYTGTVRGPGPKIPGVPLPAKVDTDVKLLMATKEGRDWWKDNGHEFHAVFDLTDGSYSRRTLDAYNAARRGSGTGATGNARQGPGGTADAGGEGRGEEDRRPHRHASGLGNCPDDEYGEEQECYDPFLGANSSDQPRDAHGRWMHGGEGAETGPSKTYLISTKDSVVDVVEHPTVVGMLNYIKASKGGHLKGMLYHGKAYVWDGGEETSHMEVTRRLYGRDLEQPDWASRFVVSKSGDELHVAPYEPFARRNQYIDDWAKSLSIPVTNASALDVDAAAFAAREPTPAQRTAGNYRKGHIRVHGLDITIETPVGSYRKGKLMHHYGYIRRTVGADGDQVDCFLGPHPDSHHVFVVDQRNADGAFDEHKVMLGFLNEAQARDAYQQNYPWPAGPITAMSVAEFKRWLRSGDTTVAVANDRDYAFSTDPHKVAQFKHWLKSHVNGYITGEDEKKLWARYIEQGYRKGAGRAFDDTEKVRRIASHGRKELEAVYAGTRESFLRSAFGAPETAEKVQLLVGRTFDELDGITSDMSVRMGRTLADGLTRGAHPLEIADELVDTVELSQHRAETVARTEIIRAHAEGQLDAFDRMGVSEVGVEVELATAGDSAVCEECADLSGDIYSIEDAHGLLPIHPNCRCALLPHLPSRFTENSRRGWDGASLGRPAWYTCNAFCPTGPGGGVDATCSPKMKLRATKQRAFDGTSKPVTATLSKQAAGALGEKILVAYLGGDAHALNTKQNNYPVDLIQDHETVEVKTGQVSNGPGAQQWRLTIGEPGKAEKAALAEMSDDEKAAWNERKQQAIHDRKEKALKQIEQEIGHPIKRTTMCVLLDNDRKVADIYKFDGFHDRIGWKSEQAKAGYIGSMKYG